MENYYERSSWIISTTWFDILFFFCCYWTGSGRLALRPWRIWRRPSGTVVFQVFWYAWVMLTISMQVWFFFWLMSRCFIFFPGKGTPANGHGHLDSEFNYLQVKFLITENPFFCFILMISCWCYGTSRVFRRICRRKRIRGTDSFPKKYCRLFSLSVFFSCGLMLSWFDSLCKISSSYLQVVLY